MFTWTHEMRLTYTNLIYINVVIHLYCLNKKQPHKIFEPHCIFVYPLTWKILTFFVPQARCDQFLSWFRRIRGGCSYLCGTAGRFNCWSVCSNVICLPRRQTYILFTSKYFDILLLQFLVDKLTIITGGRWAGWFDFFLQLLGPKTCGSRRKF